MIMCFHGEIKCILEVRNLFSLFRINPFDLSTYKNLKIMINNYSMAQQPLKSYERPLMRVSLSNLIILTFIFYYRQNDG